LKDDQSVDLTHLENALKMVLSYVRLNCTIVIESSVAVGTTRAVLGPYQNLFYCGMSPERVDPGRTVPAAYSIPKVISGLTASSLSTIEKLYSQVFDRVVPVSKPEVAEMTNLFENCYRMVNIAYVNEVSDVCLSHGIDPQEMIGAAATKPFGFQEFRPGMGVGGHCIPVNPFYLFTNNQDLPVLQQSTWVMMSRPRKLATQFYNGLLTINKARFRNGRNPSILVVGVGFKPGESVLSYSPGLSFAYALRDLGCKRLAYYDPLVHEGGIPWMHKWNDEHWTAEHVSAQFDAVAICVEQCGVDFTVISKLKQVLVYSYGKTSVSGCRFKESASTGSFNQSNSNTHNFDKNAPQGGNYRLRFA
jgi:nucleotide sugar dehydrogenase